MKSFTAICFLVMLVFVGEIRICFADELNVSYGPDPQQKLDFCAPARMGGRSPAVLLIHGGGWKAGSRTGYTKVCADFAKRGIFAATIDYRLATGEDGTRWPIQFNDAQLAMRWLRAHAETYNIDPSNICAEGDSAGGQLALLLDVVPTIDRGDTDHFFPNVSPQANCVISISGPTNLVDLNMEKPGYTNFLIGASDSEAVRSLRVSASPLLRIAKAGGPAVLIHGTDDPAVPFSQSVSMKNALIRYGTHAWLLSHPGGHELNGLSGPQIQQLWVDLAQFIQTHEISETPQR